MRKRAAGAGVLVVAVVLAVGAAFAAGLLASRIVPDANFSLLRSAISATVVGVFVALILLARRRQDFDVEEVRPAPGGVREETFVTEGVTEGGVGVEPLEDEDEAPRRRR